MAVYRQFYRIWTLKEAYIKATGQGLGFELQRADFAFEGRATDASGRGATLKIDGAPQPRWRFRFDPLDGARADGDQCRGGDDNDDDVWSYRHIACVSRGPPSHALEGFRSALPRGTLDRTMDAAAPAQGAAATAAADRGAMTPERLARCGIRFDDLLELPQPRFRRVTVRELVPQERLAEYDRAVALDKCVK